MLPYYLAAALLVILTGAIVGAFARRARTDITIASTHVRGTPTHEERAPAEPPADGGRFAARGPWVLSALPDCLRQRWEHRYGSARAAVLPAGARRIAPGTSLAAGACRITVTADRVIAARGGDRFEVPPAARLYTYDGGLLLRRDAEGRAMLRAYYLAP